MPGIKTNIVLVGKDDVSIYNLDVSGNINIDGSIYLYGVPLSFSGGGVSQSYVDGSLAERDASINVLFIENDIQDSSITNLQLRIDVIDGSIVFLDSSINQLFSQKADLSYVNQTFLRESSLGPQFYFQDGSLFVIDVSGITPDVTKSYVDGSLAERDASITALFLENDIQDVSIIDLRGRINTIDVSVSFLDSSILQLFSQKADLIYVDASLSLRDASINALFLENDIQDASIVDLKNLISAIDNSISFLDSSISQLFSITDNLEASIGSLDILTQLHEVSLGNLSLSQLEQDASLEALFIENDVQDASIENLRDRIDIIDGSIIFIDSSINQLFSQKADLSYVDGSLNQLRIDVDASFQSIELGLTEFLRPIDGTTSDVSALIVYADRQLLAGQPIYLHDPSDLGFVFDSLSTGNNYNNLPWIGINGGGSAPRLKLSGSSSVFTSVGIRGVEFYIEPGASVELLGFSEHARVDLTEIRFGIGPLNELSLTAVNATVGRVEGQTGNSNLYIKDRTFFQCQNLNEIEQVEVEGGAILFANWVRINTVINVGWNGTSKTTKGAIVTIASPQNLTSGKINVYGDNNTITCSGFPIDVSIGALNNTIIGQDNTVTDDGTNTIVLENIPAEIELRLKEASLGSQFSFDASGFLQVDVSSNGVTQIYVDGSLALRDASIGVLFIENDIQDVSISANTLAIQNLDASLDLFVLKSGDIMTGDLVIQTDLSVNGKITAGQFNVSGTSFPGSPSNGDIFYRTDNGGLFVYDSSRGKQLSVSRSTINGGRTTAVAGSTVYVRVGDATQSSTSGYKMFRNGTITAFSVQNSNTLTASRDVEIRINNAVAITGTIAIGQSGFYLDQLNTDFNVGDLVQVSTAPGGTGSALNNWIVLVEFATRS